MGKKAPKASRKLAAKGEIKRQIQERHRHQKVKKRIDGRKNQTQKVSKSNLKERGKGKGIENEEIRDEDVDGEDDPDTRYRF